MSYYTDFEDKEDLPWGEDGLPSSGVGINRESWEKDPDYGGGIGINRGGW